jgi:predicted RecB family nuclease
MKITLDLFAAYLKCPTKCWLRSRSEASGENEYADWVRTENESYRRENAQRLLESLPENERVNAPPPAENFKTTKWRLAVRLVAQTHDMESCLHAVERVPSEGQGKRAQFIPIRFVFTNKLTKDDRLLVAFDALVLSEVLGREVPLGKIIHGDDHATLKVKATTQFKEVRKRVEKIATLLSSPSPPDLVLNRHCAEKDDLSLLAGMSEKERNRHRSKGIFTVTQFSYTFRPRRTPKRAKNPAKPRYLALQALAIRENTVYIHGSPQFHESKTQVYLDIEGLPDSEFYYLIGALVLRDGQEIFHSFWADRKSDEPGIFAQFAETICDLVDCRVLHYGDYESVALKRMRARLPEHLRSKIDTILKQATNVLSVIHPHIYFPAYSNGLKDIGRFLGCERAHEGVTGLQTIVWRSNWERSRCADVSQSLRTSPAISDDLDTASTCYFLTIAWKLRCCRWWSSRRIAYESLLAGLTRKGCGSSYFLRKDHVVF